MGLQSLLLKSHGRILEAEEWLMVLHMETGHVNLASCTEVARVRNKDTIYNDESRDPTSCYAGRSLVGNCREVAPPKSCLSLATWHCIPTISSRKLQTWCQVGVLCSRGARNSSVWERDVELVWIRWFDFGRLVCHFVKRIYSEIGHQGCAIWTSLSYNCAL